MTTIEIGNLIINTDDLTVDDMPSEIFREIFEICGAEVAVLLLKYMNGNIIQVPTRGFFKLQKKIVLKEYDGTTASIRKLSRKLNISDAGIREILAENKINAPCEGQLELFEN